MISYRYRIYTEEVYIDVLYVDIRGGSLEMGR